MTSRKSADERKTEIVSVALRLADRVGPERLTTEAIAHAIGLTQPAIFRHFPTKQDLWEAVAMRIGEKMEARWAKALRPDATPTEQIRAIIAAQLRLIQSTPAIPAILFSRELHTKNKALRGAFFGLLGRFHKLIADLMEQARESGELRPDVDPSDAAFLIIGLVQGLAVRWSISGRRFDLTEEGCRLLEVQLSGFACERATTRKGATS